MERLLVTTGLLAMLLMEAALPIEAAQHSITPGELIVDPPTLICLGFCWPIEGDDNRNVVCRIEFRKKGDPKWRKGLDLWRTVKGETAGNGHVSGIVEMSNTFAGSLFDLEPKTEYECRLTITDPDGVKGDASQTITASTRPEPMPAQDGNVTHVYPYDWKGKREEPNCTGIAVWGGVRPGNRTPKPGDIFLLHAGTYKGIRNAYGGTATGLRTWFDGTFYFKADGTPERPIVFKAAGDGDVIFEGNNAEALFDVTTADYIYLEGLTLRNCRTAIRACNPLGGCTGLTVISSCCGKRI